MIQKTVNIKIKINLRSNVIVRNADFYYCKVIIYFKILLQKCKSKILITKTFFILKNLGKS